MYKKIIHHIIEEHYDSPSAVELIKNTEKTSHIVSPQPKPKAGDYKKVKDYQIYTYPILKQIEKDSINAWSLLNWRIRNLVISITEGNDDTDLLMKHAANDIEMIGSLLIPVYGESAAKKFNELLYKIVESLASVLMRIKAGRDSSDEMSKLKDDTQTFAEFVYKANPIWVTEVVKDIFTKVEDLYIAQTRSRLKKDWPAGVKAADDAYNIMVVKQDNGDASFADIYAAGIIADTVVEEVEDFMGS